MLSVFLTSAVSARSDRDRKRRRPRRDRSTYNLSRQKSDMANDHVSVTLKDAKTGKQYKALMRKKDAREIDF